jgi:hypothetical protein
VVRPPGRRRQIGSAEAPQAPGQEARHAPARDPILLFNGFSCTTGRPPAPHQPRRRITRAGRGQVPPWPRPIDGAAPHSGLDHLSQRGLGAAPAECCFGNLLAQSPRTIGHRNSKLTTSTTRQLRRHDSPVNRSYSNEPRSNVVRAPSPTPLRLLGVGAGGSSSGIRPYQIPPRISVGQYPVHVFTNYIACLRTQ